MAGNPLSSLFDNVKNIAQSVTGTNLRSVETPSATPAKAGTTSSAPGTAKDPNRLLDLLVTGLVVGAGTKPLHDLISQVQTSSGSSKAKASSTTTTS